MAEEPAFAPMDDEQVIATAQAAIGVGQNLLNLLAMDQLQSQVELDELAAEAAEVLHAILSWMPRIAEDDNQLLGALARWLP
jgi:hypothetical protein